jgi:hypothetical protein
MYLIHVHIPVDDFVRNFEGGGRATAIVSRRPSGVKGPSCWPQRARAPGSRWEGLLR